MSERMSFRTIVVSSQLYGWLIALLKVQELDTALSPNQVSPALRRRYSPTDSPGCARRRATLGKRAVNTRNPQGVARRKIMISNFVSVRLREPFESSCWFHSVSPRVARWGRTLALQFANAFTVIIGFSKLHLFRRSSMSTCPFKIRDLRKRTNPRRAFFGSLESFVLSLCLDEQREFRIGIFPRGEKVLIGLACCGGVALKQSRARQSQLRKRIKIREW